jgi:hypothetical protein
VDIIARLKAEQAERDRREAEAQRRAEAARQEAEALQQRNRVLEEELLAARRARPAAAAASTASGGGGGGAGADPMGEGSPAGAGRRGPAGLTPEEKAAMQAARHGRVEELEELLQKVHVNMANEAGNSLLVVAAQNNHKAVCKALHDRGADLNAVNRQVRSRLPVCGAPRAGGSGEEQAEEEDRERRARKRGEREREQERARGGVGGHVCTFA